MSFEYGYNKIVNEVISRGHGRPTRVGEARSMFGAALEIKSLRRKEFPLLTQRRIFYSGVFGELAAFVRGATMVAEFEKWGCNYWRPNAEAWPPNEGRRLEDMEVGRIYGNLWRKWPAPQVRRQPVPKLEASLERTCMGIANGRGLGDLLRAVWNNMLQRCYNPTHPKYHRYGGRGVYVCDAWLDGAKFAADAPKLPGWNPVTGNEGLQLDKDGLGDGFCYGPQTCQWLTPEYNNARERIQFVVSDGKQEYTFTNAYQFCLAHGLESSNLSRVLSGDRQSHQGFRLVSATSLAPPKQEYDQLTALIQGLKTDPYSRRHVMTTYNPALLTEGVLPSCHLLAQYYVDQDNYLDCQVYMRSVDLILGLPSDIALYAALLVAVAHEVNMKPGTLGFMMGDVHVYEQHVDTWLSKQNCNDNYMLPTYEYTGTKVQEFEPQQLTINSYNHSGAVKYDLNV